MKLGLLLCDHVRAGFQPIAGDYPEFFRRLFAENSEIEIVSFDLAASEFPADLDECEGWISSGSRHSVYEDVGWIHRFADLIRQLDREKRKYVGVCFGAQMIGHALGGVVQRAEQGWQVGIKEVEVEESASWMNPAATSFRILYSNAIKSAKHLTECGSWGGARPYPFH
jgi:GMP synthase-like glutamine amidotransferase